MDDITRHGRRGLRPKDKDIFSERAEEIFCAAMEVKGAAERSAYVDQACEGDARLRQMVEELLTAQGEVEQFFDESRPAMSASGGQSPLSDSLETIAREAAGLGAEVFEKPGTRIGPYRLLQVIGEGGCGAVYMAEQEKPVRRRVALKIIKLGMDTKSVIARFDAERQALARMDHPNIARVFDAGATETGRPYFVMELVRGVKLTTYCDQNQLDTRKRLNLFIQVCHAIQHAHQKGIIHRDIKPSNILVTMHDGAPMPMVIDFGIAKAVEGRLTDQTLFTAYEQFIGTPAYMSPEQAEMSRMDVDTRSDIYSLGVLLYELLTGKTPFDTTQLLQSGLDEMRRTLREREPLRPSSILTTLQAEDLTQTARFRYVEPVKLVSMLQGDLDWIVMKALEKDRNRRYQTANALAMEVQRYLDNEPILARPPSQIYRLRKLIRRNKVFFASGTALTVALAVGLGVSTELLIRTRAAEREEARLRSVAETGLQTEAELRHQAEDREKIMRAAVLIDQGENVEADQLVGQLPLERPTMEGAEVFRTLGDWNAIQGRWPAARDRYHLLLRASRAYKPTDTSLDWTRAAVAIIESKDDRDYSSYCQEAIRVFGHTEDPTVAGRTVRNCLLLPASPDLIRSLAPVTECAEKSLAGIDFSTNVPGWQIPWRCQDMALWAYRAGRYGEAMVWCRRCMAGDYRPPVRPASSRLILAMSLQQLGRTDEARAELSQARAIIIPKLRLPLATGDSDTGIWYDWVIGGILLREAQELIEGPSPLSD